MFMFFKSNFNCAISSPDGSENLLRSKPIFFLEKRTTSGSSFLKLKKRFLDQKLKRTAGKSSNKLCFKFRFFDCFKKIFFNFIGKFKFMIYFCSAIFKTRKYVRI